MAVVSKVAFSKPGWRSLVAMLLGFAVLPFASCGFVGGRMAERESATAPRNAQGIMIGAEERDLGPPDAARAVLFVHGFIGGGSNFNTLPDQLAARGWRVRVMRLPGCGTSPHDCARTTAGAMIDAVKQEIRLLRARHRRVALVTHSMGGALGVIAAASEPVDALVLGAPYFGVTYKWYYILPVETWGRWTGWLLPWTYKGRLFIQVARKEAKKDIFSYAWVPNAAARELFKLGRMADDPALLSRITCPALLIHGSNDRAASYGRAVAAVGKLGGGPARIVTLPRSNHHIYWDLEGDEVFAEVLAFLDGSDGLEGPM